MKRISNQFSSAFIVLTSILSRFTLFLLPTNLDFTSKLTRSHLFLTSKIFLDRHQSHDNISFYPKLIGNALAKNHLLHGCVVISEIESFILIIYYYCVWKKTITHNRYRIKCEDTKYVRRQRKTIDLYLYDKSLRKMTIHVSSFYVCVYVRIWECM